MALKAAMKVFYIFVLIFKIYHFALSCWATTYTRTCTNDNNYGTTKDQLSTAINIIYFYTLLFFQNFH